MKLYAYKTVKFEVINVEFISKDLHSMHWGIKPLPSKTPPPSFSPIPPFDLQTLQPPPLLRQFPPIYWFFVNPYPLKIRFFYEPP